MNINLPDNVKQFLTKLNNTGIPCPLLRDMLTSKPSLTYTLTFVASVMVALSVCHIGNVDYDRAVNFLQIVGGGYLFRSTLKHAMPIDTTITEKEQN